VGQRGFARANGALDGDKARVFEEIGHESECAAKETRRYHNEQRLAVSD
jgi:hypothetical protein